ncbi:hypothetical protein M9H77_07942 [Catharanthus roseus]|uniref:Uncharacterized protein n=1 Tax=Catharanthus roseus TaxID=4058 RepID=A0ACC0BWM3_CATRO|nr:hypothetical protein M9H77_07942 [Catharanthus roseus]
MVEKSFDEYVTEHLGLITLFEDIGWMPLLYLSGDHYPDLVPEFYATMLHKTDKNIQTIISTVKGVRMVFDRARLVIILGIRDEGNTIIVDFNRKTIQEDPNWKNLSGTRVLSLLTHLITVDMLGMRGIKCGYPHI